MTSATQGNGTGTDRPGLAAWLVAALLILALPVLALWLAPEPGGDLASTLLGRDSRSPRVMAAPPIVTPLQLRDVTPDSARQINAAVPFSTAPNPAPRPYYFKGDASALARATDCLAAAMLYEAGDDATGERAVGQVVLNRLRHPAFPKTLCGVVFQGAERTTGCQFTFTCDGAMARTPPEAAWQRARALAGAMLDGATFPHVGYSTHYHTDWVVPYWSASLEKVAAVDTHLFFRWSGWWGTPRAFERHARNDAEPKVAKLAFLSAGHRPDSPGAMATTGNIALPATSLIDDSATPAAIDAGKIGSRIAGAQLLAVGPEEDAFAVRLDPVPDPAAYEAIAARYCAGRPRCRLLGWTDAGAAPRAFPMNDAQVAAMSYAYLRVKEGGLERSLYNCRQFRNAPHGQCMRERAPGGTDSKSAITPSPATGAPRHEVIKLRPTRPADTNG